MLCIAWSGN